MFLDSFSIDSDSFIDFIIDITSVCIGIKNNKAFLLFFDWLSREEVMNYIENNTTPQTIILILKFYYSLINKREITFPENSPNGIILFKEIVNIVAYSFNCYLESTDNEYQLSLLKHFSRVLSKALNNNFVIFQVFHIYKDDTLSNILSALHRILDIIPYTEVLSYPNISLSILLLLDSLACKHLERLSEAFISLIISLLWLFIQSEFELEQSYQSLHLILDFILTHQSLNASYYEKQFESISLYFWEKVLNGDMIIIKGCEFIVKIKNLFPGTISTATARILTASQGDPQLTALLAALPAAFTQPGSYNDFYVAVEDIARAAKQCTKRFALS